jgi:N-acyl-D-aspartate/D-glutamate deacylase
VAFDLVLRGGSVVDGTGAPARVADVAIRDGKIVEIGHGLGRGTTELDVTGLAVAPGFIDLHTHFDAQVLWDGGLMPSPLHGMTTVIGGNCGFGIAPLAPSDADYAMRLLGRVEGIPVESLEAGVEWGRWESFGEWLALMDGNVVQNAGFLVGHTAVRLNAMGDRAVGEAATERDLEAMETLIRQSLAAGALGFSSSNGPVHQDHHGDPVPSRWANDEEVVRLASVVRESEAPAIAYIPKTAFEEQERMAAMSAGARRPLNWNVLVVSEGARDAVHRELSASDLAAEKGGRVLALTVPALMPLRRSLLTGFGFDRMPVWNQVLHRDVPERIRMFNSPEVRALLHTELDKQYANGNLMQDMWDYPNYVIEDTVASGNAGYQGRKIHDISAERQSNPFDTLLDIVVADELRTIFSTPPPGDNRESWEFRRDLWRNPRTIVGGSDAGAHLDMLTFFTYPAEFLGFVVRERGIVSLEEAVSLMSDAPARLYGLRGRGRIEVGYQADVVIFDPDTIAPGPVHTVHDLPGGAWRLHADAIGIEHVIINGREVVRGGQYTGETPGTVLRSGVDTEIPSMSMAG